MTYAVLIPLKATSRGKSRLGLPNQQRIALAAAMVRDTIAAVTEVPAVDSVLVVAEDSADVELLAGDRVEVMLTRVSGLNEAISDGAAELTRRGWSGPVAVLPGDLPFLTPADLTSALTAADARSAVVADADGRGTTLLVATDPQELRPKFGPDSCRLHQLTGARLLPIAAGSTLHKDVDVLADLQLEADWRQLGRHTRAAVEMLFPTAGSPQVRVLP